MKRLLSLLFVLTVLGCATPLVDRGVVSGVVVDPEGTPLPGVSVILDGGKVAMTDAKGRYRFEGVAPGNHQVTFTLAGFVAGSKTIRDGRFDSAMVRPSSVAEAITVTADAKGEREAVAYVPAPPPVTPPAKFEAVQEVGNYTGGVTRSMATAKISGAYDRQNQESYAAIKESSFVAVAEDAVSTFSIDVDRASYSNVRRFIRSGQLPPKDAVRIEEMINYFSYSDPDPTGTDPFSVSSEVASCPWNRSNRLVRVALRGRSIAPWQSKPHNLVFLVDVSGSMASADKLPLVKKAFRLLTEQLRAQDTVAIAVYAGAAGLVLPPTPGSSKDVILDAIDRLESGGSTAGAAGILLAYETAKKNFDASKNNRVILATDGDFNVGLSSKGELQQLIESQRNQGIFLSVLGFGTGNLQDSKMELLADKGNGNYGYVDTELEAKKVFVEELGGTLTTIAKDVKLQIEFNPATVVRYRLIGYENRLLADQDFDDDTKDAGELGSGHSVVALYEIEPRSQGDIAKLSLRFKEPLSDTSRKIETSISDRGTQFESASENLRFTAAVAAFGMLLRESEHRWSLTLHEVASMARTSRGADLAGYRNDFLQLLEETGKLPGVAARVSDRKW